MSEKTPLDLRKSQPEYGTVHNQRRSSCFETFGSQATQRHLLTGKDGLSSTEAAKRLQMYGLNQLPEKEDNKLMKLLLEFVRPMPVIIWIAIGIECVEYALESRRSAMLDAIMLLALQILNVVFGFAEEMKAGAEVAALKASLKPEGIVVRDGQPQKVSAVVIVPGDRVILAAGSAVPADCVVAEGQKPILVDQSAMTGESLPATLHPHDMVRMGSTVTSGESEAIVHFTGTSTFFGKTAMLIHTDKDEAHFEIVLHRVLVMLVSLGLLVCAIIFARLKRRGQPSLEVLGFSSVLLIASIPVALRVVCTCTLALGCKELAVEKAIVARLSSIEEFAGMNILCSDKTGTLTLNAMVLQDEVPLFDDANSNEVILYAALAAKWWEPSKHALDALVFKAQDCKALIDAGYVQLDYVPFDPSLKRTEAVIRTKEGKMLRFMKGVPDVVLDLCDGNRESVGEKVRITVLGFAQRGVRSLGVAVSKEGAAYRFLGLLTFLDPPRADTKMTLQKAKELGVSIKMITGDQLAIAMETSRQLGLGSTIVGQGDLPSISIDEMNDGMVGLGEKHGRCFEETDGFAQALPEHKFLIVGALRQRGHLVGMTGDGVNDAPALKRADVGIAVSGATDAAQAASDIVLTQPGLCAIVTALLTSRKIFQRMKNFVIYRVACTEQLLLFFFVSCLLVDPSEYNPDWAPKFFSIPVIALVSITILNNGTIISVAYDHVEAGASPAKWNLSSLYVVSTAIGVSALAGSLVILHLALQCSDPQSVWRRSLGLPQLSYTQIQTVMYLKISLSDYVSVFNSRCRGWLWTRAPSSVVVVSATFAMLASTVLSLVMPMGMERIDWQVVSFIWFYVIVWAAIQDMCKVITYWALGVLGWSEDAKVIDERDLEFFRESVAKVRDQRQCLDV